MTESPPSIQAGSIAVILAAGAGSRFAGDGHKLDARLDGRRLIDVAVSTALAADVGDVLVVTGAIRADGAVDTPRLAPHGARRAITILHNARWPEGQSTSLQVAVAEAHRRSADAVVVGLADQPFLDARAWRLVAAATTPIALARYGDRRGHPIRLHRSVWPLLPTTGDLGAREVIDSRPDLVDEIPCPGSPDDIDTLEDLRSWQNKSSTNSP